MPELEQMRVEVLDLILGHVRLLEHVDDLVVREEALVAPVHDECAHLIDVRQGNLDGAAGGRFRHSHGPSSRGDGREVPRSIGTCEAGPAARRCVTITVDPGERRPCAPCVLDESESHEHHPTAAVRGPAGGTPGVGHQPHEGRRHALGEGHPHPPRGRRAGVPRRDLLLVRPQPRPEGRPHVPLRGDGERGDRRGHPGRGPARRGARGAHRHQGRREPAGPAQRGHDPRQLPGREAHADHRHPHAGDVRAHRHRGGQRPHEPPGGRGQRAGHERVPVRPGAPPHAGLRRPAGRRLQRRRRGAHRADRAHRHPQPARPRDPLPRRAPGRRTWTPTCCSRSSRRACRPRSTSC